MPAATYGLKVFPCDYATNLNPSWPLLNKYQVRTWCFHCWSPGSELGSNKLTDAAKKHTKNKQPYFLPAPIIILINNSCTYNVVGFTFISLPHFVVQFSSVLSHVWLFVTPWTAAHQASLSITNSWSLLKLVSIELVIPSNHLILCHPLLLLSSIFPSIRVFTNESVLHIGGQSIGALASASVLPVNIQDWFPLGLTCLISFQSKGLSRVFSNTTVQKYQFFFVHFFFL